MPPIEIAQKTRFRSVPRPTTGSKICVLLGVLLVVAAAYFLWVPLAVPTTDGALFRCQTALNPPTADFPKNACGNLNTVFQYRAGGLLLSGLIVGGVGLMMFGFVKHPRKSAASKTPQ